MNKVNTYSLKAIQAKLDSHPKPISSIFEVSSWGHDLGFGVYNPIGFGNQLFAKAKVIIYAKYLEPTYTASIRLFFLPQLQIGSIYLLKNPSYWLKRTSFGFPSLRRLINISTLTSFQKIKEDLVHKNSLFVTNHFWGDFVDIQKHISPGYLFAVFQKWGILPSPSRIKNKILIARRSIGMHVRRGDFVVLKDGQEVSQFNTAPSDTEFFKVLIIILREFPVTIYTDMSRFERLAWLKAFHLFSEQVSFANQIVFSTLDSPADVVSAMTLHSGLVISPSTLSAWGAFLSNSPVYSFAKEFPPTLGDAISGRYFSGQSSLNDFLYHVS